MSWIKTKGKRVDTLKNIRTMAVTSRGYRIIFNQGEKDVYQVSVVVGDEAFSARDSDYFSVLVANPQNNAAILKLFFNLFDDVTNLAEVTNGDPAVDEDVIRSRLTKLHYWINNQILNQVKIDSVREYFLDLEESLLVIYLAMIAEWYYVNTKFAHRIKLLAILQMFYDSMAPEEVSQWSKTKNRKNTKTSITSEMKRLGIANSAGIYFYTKDLRNPIS